MYKNQNILISLIMMIGNCCDHINSVAESIYLSSTGKQKTLFK